MLRRVARSFQTLCSIANCECVLDCWTEDSMFHCIFSRAFRQILTIVCVRSCIEPEHRVGDFIKAGADIISVHPESTLQLAAVINKIHSAGVAPGCVLNPGTPVSAVQHVLDQCQVAVVMLVRETKKNNV